VHVAAYIERLRKARSAPTANLRMAALRHLFDWLVMGRTVPASFARTSSATTRRAMYAMYMCVRRAKRYRGTTKARCAI
jgi:hypothetical protein